MTSEMPQWQIQIEFSTNERSKAELWAWLTGGYAVSAHAGKTKSERKIVVLSKDPLKAAIRESLSSNDSERAQELLDVASKPEEKLSTSMVRKSVRVSPGEYVKLLYLKMSERTSFADVMMKVLTDPCKNMIRELESQFREKQLPLTDRLRHLSEVVELWEKEKPESRSDIAEWGDWTKSSFPFSQENQNKEPIPANEWDIHQLTVPVEAKSYTEIAPFFSKSCIDEKYIQKVKVAFTRFAMTDLTIKSSGGDLAKPASKLLYEFKDEWMHDLEEKPFLEQIGFDAYIDNTSEKQELFFGVITSLMTSVSAKRELDLFSKYGEEEVKEFIDRVKRFEYPSFSVNGHFNGITNSDEYRNWIVCFPLDNQHDDHFDVQIGTELDVICCKITASGPNSYESDWPPNLPPVLEKYRQQFASLTKETAEKVGFKITFEHDPTYPRIAMDASQLIPKAIDKAGTPEDYRTVNNLLTLKNLYDDYMTIIEFGEQVATSTLKHHSVVSFYINSDLWRIVPLVLERDNWVKLIDNYLNAKKSAQTESSK